MIRCSECKHFDKMPIKTKVFYYCIKKYDFNFKLWDKIPKTHPRWCPIYQEGKKC